MSQALKVGAFATIVLLVLGYLILRIEQIDFFAGEEQRVDAVFDSVAGLDDKAAVRVAGVRVGRVDGVGLEGRKARVSLLLERPVTLTLGSRAVIASTGLLGDKYVLLVPGPPDAPPLPEGTVLEGETPVSLDQAIARFDAIGENLQEVTGSLTGAGGDNQITRLLANLEAVSADIRDLLAANRDEVDATMRNFESASATLARELPRLADRMESVLAEIGQVVGENRGDLSASLENLRRVSEQLEPAVADLKTISHRLAEGEGSVGKLLTSDQAHDQLVSALGSIEKGVEDFAEPLGAARRLGIDFQLEGFYLGEAEEAQASLGLDLDTRSDWLYRLAAVDSAYGRSRTKTETITVTNPDGTTDVTTRTVEKVEDDITFTALLGLETAGDLKLYTGLIESSFGVQADYPLFDRKLWLTMEAFDFDRPGNLDPHLRLTGRWRFHPNFFVMGGYDDPLVGDRESFFLGGGISWNDDDLKYLLGSAPSF